ncbi:MAG: hypothetical protein HW380_3601 [Magnetococcales bacterium]|nr:hypothetical protein [Magnetococcales bacterium]
MNQQDRMQLFAEIKFLHARLDELPNSARLMRISTESRLRAVEKRLAQGPVDEGEPARVRLTFNGRPVIGSHGIFVEFGMKAVTSFTEAVTAIAASINSPLAAMGPIPNREQHQLLITNTAMGSFGFELEEYRAGQLPFAEESLVAQALDRTQNLLQCTLGTDDQLADSASETDPRALDKVRVFLQTLSDAEAICTMQYQDRGFRFTDVGQVRKSLARIGQDNLHDDEQCLEGKFLGVLPNGRTFEFKVDGQDEVIRGKVGAVILDVDQLNRHLYHPANIKVMVTRVGNGRPRYVLVEDPCWIEVV